MSTPPSLPATCDGVLVVTTDWRSVRCEPASFTATAAAASNATNAIDGEQLTHHPAFARFQPWRGRLRDDASRAANYMGVDADSFVTQRQKGKQQNVSIRSTLTEADSLITDFLGVTYPRRFLCNPTYMPQSSAHAVRVRQCLVHRDLAPQRETRQLLQTRWPVVAEEYQEYADVLQSVVEYADAKEKAHRPYAFVELGAGYGHWTLAAHAALRQLEPGAASRFLMVDVVDSLAPAIAYLTRLNGLQDRQQATSSAGSGTAVWDFHTGYVTPGDTLEKAAFGHAAKMLFSFGSTWGTGKSDSAKSKVAAPLRQVLRRYDMPCVLDMVDVDIQGGEYPLVPKRRIAGLFNGTETIRLLSHRARRVHIGLHGFPPDDLGLVELFRAWRWEVRYFPGKKRRSRTDWGIVQFNDGVLSARNLRPRLAACPTVDALSDGSLHLGAVK